VIGQDRLALLKRRVETKTGIAFGSFKVRPEHRDDYRFIIRFGYGPNREFTGFEAGVNGRAIYATPYVERVTFRDWSGRAIRRSLFRGYPTTKFWKSEVM
jgi:hypothetical protein